MAHWQVHFVEQLFARRKAHWAQILHSYVQHLWENFDSPDVAGMCYLSAFVAIFYQGMRLFDVEANKKYGPAKIELEEIAETPMRQPFFSDPTTIESSANPEEPMEEVLRTLPVIRPQT